MRTHSPRDPSAVLLLRTSVLLLLFAVACAPGERTLAPGDEHLHGARHNLSAVDDSVYRWSDPAAWPDGQLPTAGANVLIPAGRHMLLDTTPPAVRQITIAGTLEFADDQDLALSARAINVQGALVIGTAAHRYQHRAVITLTGTAAEDAPFGAGAKGIIVTGGTIELHGAPVVSWTRLGAHSRAGESTIELEREAAWHSGDRIALQKREGARRVCSGPGRARENAEHHPAPSLETEGADCPAEKSSIGIEGPTCRRAGYPWPKCAGWNLRTRDESGRH